MYAKRRSYFLRPFYLDWGLLREWLDESRGRSVCSLSAKVSGRSEPAQPSVPYRDPRLASPTVHTTATSAPYLIRLFSIHSTLFPGKKALVPRKITCLKTTSLRLVG